MKMYITDIRDIEDRRCYMCGDKLIFSTPIIVPDYIQMTQDEWDYWRQQCAEARVRGQWRGNDITHPIPWVDDDNNCTE